jgi:predicted ATPase
VGKTRLALALADDLRNAFPAGVRLVPLAAVTDSTLVLPAVAAALGVPEPRGAGSTLDALAARLAGRRTLLVLDNLEQLTAAAPAVAELLARCPDLAVLATSVLRQKFVGRNGRGSRGSPPPSWSR